MRETRQAVTMLPDGVPMDVSLDGRETTVLQVNEYIYIKYNTSKYRSGRHYNIISKNVVDCLVTLLSIYIYT